MPNLASKVFSAYRVGQRAEFFQTISEKMVRDFARLSGDQNPLHTKKAYAKTTAFGRTIAHGMLGGALFSRLIGMYLPGKNSLYLQQTLKFRKPIFPGARVAVTGEIINKSESMSLLTIRTIICNKKSGEIFTEGEALVKLLK